MNRDTFSTILNDDWRTKSGGRVETYILMGVVLFCFVGTTFGFRFLMSDPEQGMIIGAVAGLLVAIAAGGVYYSHLASCSTCI